MKLVIFDWGRTLYNPEVHGLFPDTRVTLEYLKESGYNLAIVSLATAGHAQIEERLEIIKEENLQPLFHSIKFDISDKDAMYVDTVQELHVDPADTIIVDDRVVRGIAWGILHGCKTIWVQSGKFAGELPNEKTGYPDHTVTTIGELRNIL
jgi:FMN phosphatase YigB (HAD superfamily)